MYVCRKKRERKFKAAQLKAGYQLRNAAQVVLHVDPCHTCIGMCVCAC